eukprot:11214902-Lingulodinium_polyedra.AAC.1
MTRRNRRFATATARKPHSHALHARTIFRSARGLRQRAVCELRRRRNVESNSSLCKIAETLRTNAVESTLTPQWLGLY